MTLQSCSAPLEMLTVPSPPSSPPPSSPLPSPPPLQLRKVGKSTQFSWLRMQLKQLVEKTEAVSSQVARERASVDFAPKDLEKIVRNPFT